MGKGEIYVATGLTRLLLIGPPWAASFDALTALQVGLLSSSFYG